MRTGAAKLQSLPDDVFEEIKKCDVIIKGPMELQEPGPWPNLVSANACCAGAGAFVAVRPIRIPDKGLTGPSSEKILKVNIYWAKGYSDKEDLAVDFKVQTKQGRNALQELLLSLQEKWKEERPLLQRLIL